MLVDFVYPYYSAGALGNELLLSIASVRKFFNGEARITVIGDEPTDTGVRHLPTERVLPQKHQAFRDVFNKLQTAVADPDIADEFVWMMDDIWFAKPTTIEQLRIPRHQGQRNRQQLHAWRPSNSWLRLKKKTQLRLCDEGVEIPYDFATHLPHVVTKQNIIALAERFNMPKEMYLWEVIYGNLYKQETVEHFGGFFSRWRKPQTDEQLKQRFAEANIVNSNSSSFDRTAETAIAKHLGLATKAGRSISKPRMANRRTRRRLNNATKKIQSSSQFDCNHRGKKVGERKNRLCSKRGSTVDVYQCNALNQEVTISPYQVGQPEPCCKRCDKLFEDATTVIASESEPSIDSEGSLEQPEITAVMNAFGRPDKFLEQKQAILSQTIRPKEILTWHNHNKHAEFENDWFRGTTYASCNFNLGVWPRFAFALNARTEFVCVFDDDTIPGNRWFENCIETLKTHNGLLGSAGVIFRSAESYRPFTFAGWRRPSSEVQRVDIVGHAWFFRREWLSAFWSEMPSADLPKIAGEDMHFSFALQKRGINTYCPPHPPNDPSLWGSLRGREYGRSGPAISKKKSGWRSMDACLKHYHEKGFQLINI